MLKRIFTWWNGATIGALFDINRRGSLVGEDEQGNRYFEERKASLNGRPRRWVLYNGVAEISRVPPGWRGWLNYVFDDAPSVRPLPTKAWELPHEPNLTGTVAAYRPKGSLANRGERARTTADYEAWKPD